MYTDNEKLHYLFDVLKDPDAKGVVDESMRNEDDYDGVTLRLQRLMERSRKVMQPSSKELGKL